MATDRARTITGRSALAGRAVETSQIHNYFAAAAEGAAHLVRVRCPMGMGTTAFLDSVHFPGAEVLRGSGATSAPEAAAEADYSEIRTLLAPLAGHSVADRQLPVDAMLGSLSRPVLARLTSNPVVLILDDVHRCQPTTVRWLDFLLSRAAALPLFVLLGQAADQQPRAGPLLTELVAQHRCATIELAPLSVDAITELLGGAFGEQPHPALARACAELSRGKPAVLRQLIAAVRQPGVRPDAHAVRLVTACGTGIAIRAGLADLRRRPASVQAVAGAIAVLRDADPELVGATAGIPPPLVDRAVRALRDSGLLAGSPAAFVPDGLADAILDDLPDAERTALRVRAARALNVSRPVCVVADQLLALTTIDEPWMRDVLHEAGILALRRGAPRRAERYLSRLLALEPDRDRLRLDLARALTGTDPEAAMALLRTAATDPHAAADRAWAALAARNPSEAIQIPGQADADPESLRLVVGCDRKSMIATIREPPAQPGTEPWAPLERHILAARSMLTALRGTELGTAVESARRALSGDTRDPNHCWADVTASRTLLLADHLPLALDGLNRAVTASRTERYWTEHLALAVRSHAWADGGDLNRAADDAEAALSAADRGGMPAHRTLPTIALAGAALARGCPDRADQLLDGLRPARFSESVWEYHQYLMVLAELRWKRRDLPGALDALTTCGRSLGEARIGNPVFAPWWMSAAWLLTRTGDRPRATELAELGEGLAASWPTSRGIGLSLLARSAVTPGRAGIDLLAEAVRVLATSPARTEHARAQYLLGRALLRADDRAGARLHLRRAVLLASRYGLALLAGHARRHLLDAGGRMPAVSARPTDLLTDRERRVAELAAAEVPNKEIAEILFVTVRTVEFHLRNVYRKLGVSCRGALSTALTGEPERPAPRVPIRRAPEITRAAPPVPRRPVLVERERELAVLSEVIAAARSGQGAVVLIRGPLGIGRSALLDGIAALAGAEHARVLRARASRPQQGFALGVMRQLLESEPTDAAPRPCVLLIDDLHWADHASLHWLAGLARQRDQARLVLVGTVPDGDPDGDRLLVRALGSLATHRLRPEPLSRQGIRTLVEADEPGVRHAYAESGGNPLLLSQVLADPDGRLNGSRSPVHDRIAASLARQPEPVRTFARAMALAGADVDPLLIGQLSELAPAEANHARQVLRRLGLLLDQRSPRLLRACLREIAEQTVTPAEYEDLQLRTATVLHAAGAPAERVAACLLAVSRPTGNWTVPVLRAAADAALCQGNPAEAVGYLRRALRDHPPGPADRVQPLVELATAERTVDPPASVRHIAQAIALLPGTRDRAALLGLLPPTAFGCVSRQLDEQAAEVAGALRPTGTGTAADRALASGLEARLWYAAREDPARPAAAAARLAELGPGPPVSTLADKELAAVLLYTATLGAGLPAAEVSTLVEYLAADPPAPAILPLLLTCAAAVEPTHELAAMIERARGTADHLITGSVRALLALRTGRMDVALRIAGSACERATEVHETSELSWAALRAVAIAIDDPELSSRILALGPQRPVEHGCLLLWSSGVLLSAVVTAADDPRPALGRIHDCGRRLDQAGWLNPQLFPWRSWAAQLHGRLGEHSVALDLIEQEHELARAWGAPSTVARTLRVRGTLLGGRNGVSLLHRATELLRTSTDRVELAKALISLGVAELRLGDERADERLRCGLRLAEDCGAQRTADQLKRLLAANGLRLPDPDGMLTAAEERIARWAAAGQTNQDIATTLGITRRAVEKHLTSCYRKLGIRGRSELDAVLRATGDRT